MRKARCSKITELLQKYLPFYYDPGTSRKTPRIQPLIYSIVGTSVLRLDPYTLKFCHAKMKAIIKDHLISKIWGEIYPDHIEYELPQDEGDESYPITLRRYLANMTTKTVKYDRDQLLHAISHDNNPTTVNFIYFTHHKVEETQVLNGLTCILSEELLLNPNYFMTRSGIEQANMGIWDK